MSDRRVTGRGFVIVVALIAGAVMLAAGIWSLGWPRSFADAVSFPYNEHFLHDLGAFQIGIGITLLLAVVWSDALATALAAFLVANTVHVVNHVVDRDLGGSAGQTSALAVGSVVVAVALLLRLRQLGYLLGRVALSTDPALAPFVRQKTARLTTYRRDGRPGSTPLSIAVDGDRAFVRSYEKSLKTLRIRRNPSVQIGACTATGRPTGPTIEACARRLSGAESRHAAALLRAKYPVLHGILVPLAHRVLRSRTGRTVHFEVVPLRPAG